MRAKAAGSRRPDPGRGKPERQRTRTKQPTRAGKPAAGRLTIVKLLDQLAKLMKRERGIDRRALDHLEQLRLQMQFAVADGSAERRGALPEAAPARWLDRRDRNETPADFIRREYAGWLGHGLTRAHIRKLDESLYARLANWLLDNKLPKDIDLPTKKEANDRQLRAIESSLDTASISAKEYLRLRSIRSRRAG